MARAQKFTPTSSWAQGTDASAGTTANVNPVTSNPRSRNTFFCPSAGPSASEIEGSSPTRGLGLGSDLAPASAPQRAAQRLGPTDSVLALTARLGSNADTSKSLSDALTAMRPFASHFRIATTKKQAGIKTTSTLTSPTPPMVRPPGLPAPRTPSRRQTSSPRLQRPPRISLRSSR